MGVPARSVNCFEGCGFLPFAALPLGTGAMRVPSPAAGMMTMTFIAGCKYTDAERQLQIAPGKRAPRMQVAPQTPKEMARTGIAQSSPEIKKNYDAGFGSAPTA